MDYFPNEEGVIWFAKEIFPGVRARFPHSRFVVAGSNPTLKVRALARLDGVEVTGFVEDMRKEQERADVVVVPLRIARGMQNKVLEAMACGKAVVVARKAMGGIDAQAGRDLMVSESAEEFSQRVMELLSDPGLARSMGQAAREYILRNFSWEANLEHGLLPLLKPVSAHS
jgi:glycosyltransferase involved in cell wall biosynthesis